MLCVELRTQKHLKKVLLRYMVHVKQSQTYSEMGRYTRIQIPGRKINPKKGIHPGEGPEVPEKVMRR